MDQRLGDTLSRACSGARHLVIAAPYIKADALTKVLANVSPTASLLCITRWNPHDLAAGASDAECRILVTKRGGSFRLHPFLHAKYYRVDDVILVGSANLTASALGWSPQPNLEVLCCPGDDFDADAFQKALLQDAREINDAEFAHWQAIARINTPDVVRTTGKMPGLDSWRPSTRNPLHIVFTYRRREDQIASPDEQRAAQRDIQALLIPPDPERRAGPHMDVDLSSRRPLYQHRDTAARPRRFGHPAFVRQGS